MVAPKKLCHRLSSLLTKHLGWWSWTTNFMYGIIRSYWKTGKKQYALMIQITRKNTPTCIRRRAVAGKILGPVMLLHIAGQRSEQSTQKETSMWGWLYLNKFQNELGLDPKTSSVTQEDNKEAGAITWLLANNPLPHERMNWWKSLLKNRNPAIHAWSH